MKYEVYTDEILKAHTLYTVEANSEEEAIEKVKNGSFSSNDASGDIYDSEIVGYEITKIE